MTSSIRDNNTVNVIVQVRRKQLSEALRAANIDDTDVMFRCRFLLSDESVFTITGQ